MPGIRAAECSCAGSQQTGREGRCGCTGGAEVPAFTTPKTALPVTKGLCQLHLKHLGVSMENTACLGLWPTTPLSLTSSSTFQAQHQLPCPRFRSPS